MALKIVLVGGSGFLGAHLARALIAAGHEVLILSRRGRGPLEGARYLEANAATGKGLGAIAEADAVGYLAGIIREREQTFEEVHVEGVQNVLGAMQAAGVRRLLHVSALGARPGTQSRYFETKAQGEMLVEESGLEWTILRPSLVFGQGDEFFAKVLKGLVRMPLPFIPLIGDGRYPFRPIWAGDVAQVFCQALEKHETIGQRYDLVGPEEYTYKELVRLVRDALGASKPLFSLPVAFFRLVAALPGAPLTRDQLAMLLLGNTGNPAKMLEVFELSWRRLEDELKLLLN